jgi:hypothetical protein
MKMTDSSTKRRGQHLRSFGRPGLLGATSLWLSVYQKTGGFHRVIGVAIKGQNCRAILRSIRGTVDNHEDSDLYPCEGLRQRW